MAVALARQSAGEIIHAAACYGPTTYHVLRPRDVPRVDGGFPDELRPPPRAGTRNRGRRSEIAFVSGMESSRDEAGN